MTDELQWVKGQERARQAIACSDEAPPIEAVVDVAIQKLSAARAVTDDTKQPPGYAPVYAAALYPELATLAREHGYALCVHGSLRRDFDLVAVAWAEKVSEPQTLVDAITTQFAIKHIGEVGIKNHGRIAYTLSVGFGQCAVDLSFTPRGKP